MGKRKYLDKIENLFEKSPVVSFQSIERIIGKSKKSSYAKLVVNNLLKKGKIVKIAKGMYSKYQDVSLAVFCFKPSYLGLQSSLSHYGMWEQETIPVILTAKSVRTGLRMINGSNVYIRKIKNRYFFGVVYKQEGDFYVPYADLEKTCIDMVVFRQKMGKPTVHKLKGSIDHNKLKRYLKVYPPIIKKQVESLFSAQKNV